MTRRLYSCLLLPAFFPSFAQAQSDVEPGTPSATTVASTITVVPVAHGASTPELQTAQIFLPPVAPTCSPGKATCPACGGESVTLDTGSTYKIYCDSLLRSNTSVIQLEYVTSAQCLLACDMTLECLGTTRAGNGSCALAVGSQYDVKNSTGDIAFVSIPHVPSNSLSNGTSSAAEPFATKFFSSASTTPKVLSTAFDYPIGLHPPKPLYTNFMWPNATHPSPNGSFPLNNTCFLANPTCPACNNKTLTDSHNVTYTVLCGYSLDAKLDYGFGEPLTALSCLSRCDQRNTTCYGASWSTEECALALGPILNKIGDPDHIAFLRLRVPQSSNTTLPISASPRPPIASGAPYLNISSYNGGPASAPPLPSLTGSTPSIDTSNSWVTQTIPLSSGVASAPVAYGIAPGPVVPVTETTEPSASASPEVPWVPQLPYGGPAEGQGYGGQHRGPPWASHGQGGRPFWAHWGWGSSWWGGKHRMEEE